MTNLPLSSPDILLGSTVLLGGRHYELKELLGGGATALVFLGTDPNELDNPDKQVAVKVAKAEEQWQKALKQEWRNLCVLQEAEKTKGTNYFPRVLWPPDESRLLQNTNVMGMTRNFYILVQELVRGMGVHDLLLDYPPGLRLPEPLALEIARQYAEMLIILHASDLTCSDRKLSDLRWRKKYNLRTENPDDLARWPSEPFGHLTVLDWNVTGKASKGVRGTIALDLFRFGVLWHRMLLGVKPRFRQGENWQLEEPLEKQSGWACLSYGTRQILGRLLHPVPERRYLKAAKLLTDVNSQIELWQAKEQSLVSRFRPVYEAHVESFDHPEKTPRLDQVEAAFDAADVLRVRIENWGAWQPDFDRPHRGLKWTLAQAPWRQMQAGVSDKDWARVLNEIERLRARQYNPAWLLHLGRLEQIAARANQVKSDWQEVERLFKHSNLIFDYDQPGEARSDLSDKHVADWQAGEKAESDPGWKAVKAQLWQEAGYRLALAKARSLKNMGKYREAEKVFRHLSDLRYHLKKHDTNILTRLDQLYGDPTPELKEIENIVQAGQDVEGVLVQSLRTFISDSPDTEKALSNIEVALRARYDDSLLIRAFRLLEAELDYQRVHQDQSLELEEHYLKQLGQSWSRFVSELNKEEGQSAEFAQDLQKMFPDVEQLLSNRRTHLEDRKSQAKRTCDEKTTCISIALGPPSY